MGFVYGMTPFVSLVVMTISESTGISSILFAEHSLHGVPSYSSIALSKFAMKFKGGGVRLEASWSPLTHCDF